MHSQGPPVGYLLADIEASTERWERSPAQMQVAVARLDVLIEDVVSRNGGKIQDRSGDGVFALFTTGNPLQCALDMQLEMQRTDWSAVGGLDLRIGVHASINSAPGQLDRAAVNRGARIMASGWGGQIVVSRDAARLYKAPRGATLTDLGLCRFKGVGEAIHLASLGHPELVRSEFPPPRSLQFNGNAIDALAIPMFGRQAELGDILHKLKQVRQLTITGPGGNGKTRLALQVGAEITARQPVCFTSLAGMSRDTDLPSVIAAALRLESVAGRSLEEHLIDYLRDKQMLIVLDNAEIVAGRAAFIDTLIGSCPQLGVLATSREPLGVENELIVRLPGIDLLDANGQISKSSPAVQLFVHEAKLKDPAFELADQDLACFEEIYAAVHGSPLALRLIAQWTSLLSLGEILERLHESLAFLSDPSVAQPGQNLRGVFEGSWTLLSQQQQATLAKLSVFVKAFDLTAAAHVTGADLADFLTLERKGLIVRAANGRFAMHALVRDYAAERLEANSAQAKAALRQHATYYLEAVRACMEGTQLPSRGAASEQLRQDIAEIRAAWVRAIGFKAKALLQNAIEPLCYFLYTRSMFRDAVDIFGVDIANDGLRRHAAAIRANFLVHQGDAEGSAAAASSALAGPGASQLAKAHANQALGNLAHMRGEFKQAHTHYMRAAAIREKVGDLRGFAYASIALGALHLLFERVETAREHIKSGYRIARQVGDPFGMMVSHLYAGDLAAAENRLEDAMSNYEMGLGVEDSTSNTQFRAMFARRLGALFALKGDAAGALAHHQQAHDLSRDVGDQRTRAHALIEMGNDLRLMGDLPNARMAVVRGIRLSMNLGMQPALRRGLLELAYIDLALGNVEAVHRSVRALERADLGDLRSSYDALVTQLKGGRPANMAPVTVQDLLSELVAEAEVDTLKL
ncbi:MAG: hypothetical protein JNL81_15640 [Hyphomonadaceae bacterium]|nr:hypothetical protein [Hyphomonadaceae bacterium]